MGDDVSITGRDEDIAVIAFGKVFAEIGGRIIRAIENKEPFNTLARQRSKSIVVRATDASSQDDIAKAKDDCLMRACINVENVGKATKLWCR